MDDEEYEGEKPKWEGEYKLQGATAAHPQPQVSWYDAVMFCNWLSEKENRHGRLQDFDRRVFWWDHTES